jgi:predicted AlkP superfamily pyrophosphatase or phosphodiesterase
MKRRRNTAVLVMLAALLVAGRAFAQKESGVSQAASPAKAKTAATRPKLVVLLVVDQMRADYVEDFRQQWTEGLARLVNDGAWFRQAAYPYATTVTCAGHTTIATGAYPATTGMIANSWYERDEDGGAKTIACTADSHYKNIGYGGETSGGDSPARLRVTTFSDSLREGTGGRARVVSFSLKARAAISMAGHHADAIAWHDENTGVWATSSYFGESAFVAEYTKAHPVSADFGKTWTPALPDSAYLYNDPLDNRHAPAGWTTAFPHPLRGLPDSTGLTPQFYVQWEESPYSDEYMAHMAEAAVDALKLGQTGSTDYLAISFSALDHVGHDMGPHSHEIQDVLVRLDRDVGELLAHLDAEVGRGNYVVAFTSDHGVAPIPEQAQRDGLGGGRVSGAAIRQRVNDAARRLIGDSNAVAAMVDGDISFTPTANERFRQQPDALRAIIAEIEIVPGVFRVYTAQQLFPLPQTPDPILRAESLSYVPGRSGDLVVVLRPYFIFGTPGTAAAPAGGTTHGNPYLYDQRVPILFYGWGIRSGKYAGAASPADIAPTFAYLCGVTLARVDGHVLTDAVAEPARAAAR